MVSKNNSQRLAAYLADLRSYPTQFINGCDNKVTIQNIQFAHIKLKAIIDSSINPFPRILINEPDPVKFISFFLAASAVDCQVFLCNPDWGKLEWQQVLQLAQPNFILGSYPPISQPSLPPSADLPRLTYPHIMIPTGGTSGKIKFTVHTWDTLSASVFGFLEHFQLQTANFICTLPLYHVSGLMQLMRTLLSGGRLAIYNFKQLETASVIPIHPQDFFISLVPTQLWRLFKNPLLIPWLKQMSAVLLGGAPPGEDLLNLARSHDIPLALTYGMTETASQVATLLPEQFLKGASHCGQVLPHAKINIVDGNGNLLPKQSIGEIQIKSNSLTLGYYGSSNSDRVALPYPAYRDFLSRCFQPDDLGFFDRDNNLHILGRNSEKIITGGENVFPVEIEAAIFATGLVMDIKIIGVPDPEWGEAVTAICVPNPEIIHDPPEVISLRFKSLLKAKLSKFKVPKYWVFTPKIHRNSQGKVNLKVLRAMALDYLAFFHLTK